MKKRLVAAETFCIQHNIGFSFLSTLGEYGLVEMTTVRKNYFISEDQLGDLEKMVRLHRDLNINPEGIDSITYLLKQLNDRQIEITSLRNKLRRYEDVDE